MMFDPCPHLVKMIVISAGRRIRELKGLPLERDITKLYMETCEDIGVPPILTNTSTSISSISQHEMKKEDGTYKVPRKPCPKCEQIESFVLFSLCKNCRDSEGNKYKTTWKCVKCGYQEKSEKPMVKWLGELGVEFNMASKNSLGIKTITDEGLK